MLQLVARLLVALGVTAAGLTGAQTHASPAGSDHSAAAVEAVIAAAGASAQHIVATGAPTLTGLDLALTKANEHAATGLATAIAAKAAGQAKGEAASGAAGENAAGHAPTLPAAAAGDAGAGHRP